MIGSTFGRLTVIGESSRVSKNRNRYYLWFAEDSGANWLLTAHAVQEFEVVSELGEM
jgi:hypothetical protein